MRITFAKAVQHHLQEISVNTGFLWQKEGVPSILLKVSGDIPFLSSKIGHGDIQRNTAQPDSLSLKLLLQPQKQSLISLYVDLHDEQAIQSLAAVEQVDVHAVAADLTYLGYHSMPWPATKRQTIAFMMGIPLPSPSSPERASRQSDASPSLLELHRRVQRQLHYLEHLSISFIHKDLSPQVRRLHILEERISEQARVLSLNTSHVQSIVDSMAAGKLTFVSSWQPSTSLWIEFKQPFTGYARPRCGLLLLAPQDKGPAFNQQSKWRQSALPDRLDYSVKVVDEQGKTLLRLFRYDSTSERPSPYWAVAPSHQCPYDACEFASLDLPRPLRSQPPLRLCSQCQREVQFWRRALAAIFQVIQQYFPNVISRQKSQEEKKPEKKVVPTVQIPAPSPKKEAKAPAVPKTPKPPKPAKIVLPETPKVPPPPKSKPHPPAFQPVPPFSIQTLPCMVGIPWFPAPSAADQKEPPGVLLKLPSFLLLETCTLGYGTLTRNNYPEGSVFCLQILLRSETTTLTAMCLICPVAGSVDARLLAHLTDSHTRTLRLKIVSDDTTPRWLGQRALPWQDEQRQQMNTLKPHISSRGESTLAKKRWLSEHPIARLHNLPVRPQSESIVAPIPDPVLPREMLPKSLIGRFAANVLQETAQQDRDKDPHIEALRHVYECEVDDDGLRLLRQLLEQQSGPILHRLPYQPATHCWFTFATPIPFAYGKEVVEIAGVWMRKQPTPVEASSWVCTLIGAQATSFGFSLRYTPKGHPIWQLSNAHSCPTQECQQEAGHLVACTTCQKGLEFWATVLSILSRMLRGDYATRVDTRPQEDARLIWSRLRHWELLPITTQKRVVTYKDADMHTVHQRSQESLTRESWLQVLRQIRPELIEQAIVTTIPFTRHLRSGKEIVISPYDMTVYRRKDRHRKTRLGASQHSNETMTENRDGIDESDTLQS